MIFYWTLTLLCQNAPIVQYIDDVPRFPYWCLNDATMPLDELLEPGVTAVEFYDTNLSMWIRGTFATDITISAGEHIIIRRRGTETYPTELEAAIRARERSMHPPHLRYNVKSERRAIKEMIADDKRRVALLPRKQHSGSDSEDELQPRSAASRQGGKRTRLAAGNAKAKAIKVEKAEPVQRRLPEEPEYVTSGDDEVLPPLKKIKVEVEKPIQRHLPEEPEYVSSGEDNIHARIKIEPGTSRSRQPPQSSSPSVTTRTATHAHNGQGRLTSSAARRRLMDAR